MKLACIEDDPSKLFVRLLIFNAIKAIKILRKSILRKKREYYWKKEGGMGYKDALDNVLKEIAIMKKLDHPNVIQLHEVLDDEEEDKLYMGKQLTRNEIVMDYAKYGEVLKWNIKNLQFVPYDS